MSSIPYCGLPPEPSEILARWNTDPVLLLVLLALSVLGVAYRRHLNTASYAGAMLMLLIVFVSPICALSSSLFSVRAIHHLLVVGIAAPLLAFALPARFPVSLPAAALAKMIALSAWHVPAIYEWTLTSDVIYWIMQAGLLGSSFLFWYALRKSDLPTAFAGLASIMMLMGIIGAILSFAAVPFYAAHLMTTWSWGLSPLDDQQLAGLIMWSVSIPIYVLAAAVLAARALMSEHKGAVV